MPGGDGNSPSLAGHSVRAQRPTWWIQVLLVGFVWWVYDVVNNLNPLRAPVALANGLTIVHIETVLHLDPERGLNRWLSSHLVLGRWLGNYYDLAHFAVTIGVLAFVWWRHPGRYPMLRNALLTINLIGFIVFWAFPVAPPRMLTGLGFVDVVAVAHSVGAWSTGSLASHANDYAAMPSLHVAWALWCSFAVWQVRTDRISRAVAVGYAALTVVVVLATANHYFLDVVGGAVTTAAAAAAAAGRLTARGSWGWRRRRGNRDSRGVLEVQRTWPGWLASRSTSPSPH